MARAKFRDVVLDGRGNVIEGASVHIYELGTTTPLAETIYDRDGDPLTNPLTTNALGEFEFYLDAVQRVTLVVTLGDLETDPQDVDVLNATDVPEHETDTTAHPASSITTVPYGNLAGTTVQVVLQELDDEKQAVSQKGSAGGYASLDGSGFVPDGQIPATIARDAEVAAGDALLIPLTQKAAAFGVATLDAAGKIPVTQIPAVAITDTYPVASQAAMLALTAERGDVAIRSDLNKSFILATDDPTQLADWLELKTPTDAVLSVDGRTGAVTLSDLYDALGTASAAVATHDGLATHPHQTGALTQGSVVFVNGSGALAQDNASLFWDDTNNRLGIGTPLPVTTFHVSDGNPVEPALLSTDKLVLSQAGDNVGLAGVVASSAIDGHRAVFKGVRARGTLAAPVVPILNDKTLSFLGAIWDGVTTQGTALVDFLVDGAVSAGVAPQRIAFTTSATDSVARAERWVIKSTGHLLAGADNTYDIGATGATRPRDLHLGRNALIAGTLGVTGQTDFASLIQVTRSSATASAFQALVTGGVPRVVIRADGQIEWGDGTNARDTTLARSAAGVLQTGSSFVAPGTIIAGSASGVGTEKFYSVQPGSITGSGTARTSGARWAARTTDVVTTAQTADVSVVQIEQQTYTSTPAGTVIPDLAGLRVRGPVTSGPNATATRAHALLVETGGDANRGVTIKRSAVTQTEFLLDFFNDSSSRMGGIDAGARFRPPDGTVGAPGYAFTNDSDSGLYRIGSDNLGITVGGTLTQEFKSNGQVALPRATAAGQGLLLGGDTEFYRSGADTIRTDDLLQSLRALSTEFSFMASVNGDVAARFVVTAAGGVEFGSGAGARDVHLSRAAANRLGLAAGDEFQAGSKIYPGTAAGALQTSTGITGGTGAPNNANGSDGDIYIRADGGALTTIYQKRAGSWVGLI